MADATFDLAEYRKHVADFTAGDYEGGIQLAADVLALCTEVSRLRGRVTRHHYVAHQARKLRHALQGLVDRLDAAPLAVLRAELDLEPGVQEENERLQAVTSEMFDGLAQFLPAATPRTVTGFVAAIGELARRAASSSEAA